MSVFSDQIDMSALQSYHSDHCFQIDCSGKEAAGSRAVRYETDTQLFERWKYPRLWFPPPHGILTLHRSHIDVMHLIQTVSSGITSVPC